jgi:hypothetical protein
MWVLALGNFEGGKDQKKLDYPLLRIGSLFVMFCHKQFSPFYGIL